MRAANSSSLNAAGKKRASRSILSRSTMAANTLLEKDELSSSSNCRQTCHNSPVRSALTEQDLEDSGGAGDRSHTCHASFDDLKFVSQTSACLLRSAEVVGSFNVSTAFATADNATESIPNPPEAHPVQHSATDQSEEIEQASTQYISIRASRTRPAEDLALYCNTYTNSVLYCNMTHSMHSCQLLDSTI